MWMLTPTGFYSAVQHRDDADLLVVRTRVRADAQALEDWYDAWRNEEADAAWPDSRLLNWPTPEIVTYEFSDYPWRVIIPRKAWADFLVEQTTALDYGNFKDAVKAAQGPERAQTYTKVWTALLDLEDQDPEARATTPLGHLYQGMDDEAWADYDAWETNDYAWGTGKTEAAVSDLRHPWED